MLLNSLLSAEEFEPSPWFPLRLTPQDSSFDVIRAVLFWVAVVFLLQAIVVFFAVRGEQRKQVLRVEGAITVTNAGLLCLAFLVLAFIEDGIKPILFYPILVLIAVVAAGGAILFFNRSKGVLIAVGCAAGAALIATFVCMGVNYADGSALEDNWLTEDQVNTVGLYVGAVLLIAAIIAAAFLLGRKDKKGWDTRSLTFAAVCIAMSFALSYLKVVEMPQGGSITIASLLPLMIYSYMFGTKKGVFAGFIYGILQAFQDTYILHPAQFLLDYPVAFSAIGLAGMFAHTDSLRFPQLKFALGAVVAVVGRFIAHFLSGIFAFGAFATIQPVWLYSLVYQAGYVLPDLAIVIVVGILVFSSKTFLKEMERIAAGPAKAAKTALLQEAAAAQPAAATAQAAQSGADPATPEEAKQAQK